jgi:hypothetical protein
MLIIELLDEDNGWIKAGELDLSPIPRDWLPLQQVLALMLINNSRLACNEAFFRPPGKKPCVEVRCRLERWDKETDLELHRFDTATAESILINANYWTT